MLKVRRDLIDKMVILVSDQYTSRHAFDCWSCSVKLEQADRKLAVHRKQDTKTRQEELGNEVWYAYHCRDLAHH